MKRVGVIGGGQLAWMMGGAARKLGVDLVVQTPSANDPAVAIAQDTIFAPVDDAIATAVLAQKCDVITFENEFVNLNALSLLAHQGVCFRPKLEALAPLLDKYHQRCYLQNLGLSVPRFFALEEDTDNIRLGFPVVLKARRHGYDGQGTFIAKDPESLKQRLEHGTTKSKFSQQEFLLEEFIPFERELAIIAARSVSGEVVTYPIVETQQEQQVCRRVIAPADITPQVAAEVKDIACTLLNSLDAVGVFGIELFLTTQDKVLVNEIAPRTHNSGHFSLDACETSQFEQQLRAVCGLSLGNPAMHCAGAVMVNLLGIWPRQTQMGQELPDMKSEYSTKLSLLQKIPQAHVYWYGKVEPRPGRKLGHVTVCQDNPKVNSAIAIAQTIESIWYSS